MAMGHRPVERALAVAGVAFCVPGSTFLTGCITALGGAPIIAGFKHVYVDSINLNFGFCRETTSAPCPLIKGHISGTRYSSLPLFMFMLPARTIIMRSHARGVHTQDSRASGASHTRHNGD